LPLLIRAALAPGKVYEKSWERGRLARPCRPWERGTLAALLARPGVRRDERLTGGDAPALRGWPAYAWGRRGGRGAQRASRAPSGRDARAPSSTRRLFTDPVVLGPALDRPGPDSAWQGPDPEGAMPDRHTRDLLRSGLCHGLLRPGPLALALAGYLAGVVGLVPWYRRFGVPARYAALYPLAVAIFGLVTADSTWRLLARRGAAWKGRTYR